MFMRLNFLTALILCATGTMAATAEKSPVERISEDRVRVGNIEINTREQTFSVAGSVIEQDKIDAPMEFIAVSKGGIKSYEALLELDTTAIDFNLACILIGLDEANATRPTYHFDPSPTLGDAVFMQVGFEHGGKKVTVSVEQLLSSKNHDGPHDWVYTGSAFYPNGDYIAEATGTLVGFVHDPESIIQHKQGLGLGDYGAVTLNEQVLPPAATPITFTLSRRKPGEIADASDTPR